MQVPAPLVEFSVPDSHKRIVAVTNISHGDHNALFAPALGDEEHVCAGSGLGLDKTSRLFAPDTTQSSATPQVLALFVPLGVLASSLGIFTTDKNGRRYKNVLAILLEATRLREVGHPDNPRSIDGVKKIPGLDGTRTVPVSRVFLETVETEDGRVLGYRFFFVTHGPATWADLVAHRLAQNVHNKTTAYGREWSSYVRSNPHYGITDIKSFVTLLGLVSGRSEDYINDLTRQSDVFDCALFNALCPANPVNVLDVASVMEPGYLMRRNRVSPIKAVQADAAQYVDPMCPDTLTFPLPEHVCELPDRLCSIRALAATELPSSNANASAELRSMLAEYLTTRSSAELRRLEDQFRLNAGVAVVEEEPIDVADPSELFIDEGDTGAFTASAEDFYAHTLDIYKLRTDFAEAKADLVRLRESPNITCDMYNESVAKYHAWTLELFEQVIRPGNEKLTAPERAIVTFLDRYAEANEKAGRGAFPFEDIFALPLEPDADVTLEFESEIPRKTFEYFEALGALNDHANLMLMWLLTLQAGSYDFDIDNAKMVMFGGAGVGKSRALRLFQKKLLIRGTVESANWETRCAMMTEGHTIGLIQITHEANLAALGMLVDQPGSTGDSIAKSLADPEVSVSYFNADDNGTRTRRVIVAIKRRVELIACNERQDKMPEPMADRTVALNVPRSTRYSKSAAENAETEREASLLGEESIHTKFKLMQALVNLTRWLIDSGAIFLPNGIAREGAIAVVLRFKQKMRDLGFDIDSSRWTRALKRIYPFAETLAIIIGCCKVMAEMHHMPRFSKAEFALRIRRHLYISEMVMRWTIQLCVCDFVDPMYETIVAALSHVLHYASNPREGVNGTNDYAHTVSSLQPVTGTPFLAGSGVTIAPVRYARKPTGEYDYNYIECTGPWGRTGLAALVVERCRSGAVEPSVEHVEAAFARMRQAVVSAVPRVAHRMLAPDTAPVTIPVNGPKGPNGEIRIAAAFFDEIVGTNIADTIDTVLRDISYPGQAPRSTLSLSPVPGYPHVLPRITGDHSPDAAPYRYKNVHYKNNPDHSDRSEFARELSFFDRRSHTFTRPIDEEVVYHHLLSIGHPMHTAADLDCLPYVLDGYRKFMQYARDRPTVDEVESTNAARALAAVSTDALDAEFTPSYPLPAILAEVDAQVDNEIERYPEGPPTVLKCKITDLYQAALGLAGLPAGHLRDRANWELGAQRRLEGDARSAQRIESRKRALPDDVQGLLFRSKRLALGNVTRLDAIRAPPRSAPVAAPAAIEIGEFLDVTDPRDDPLVDDIFAPMI